MQINRYNNLTFCARKYSLIPANVLIEQIKQDKTYSKIAKEYNVSSWVVKKSMQEIPLTSFNEIDNYRIMELYNRGLDVKNIRKRFGFPRLQIQLVIDSLKSKSNSSNLIFSIVKKLNLNTDVMMNLK